jgi:hypothetical protein
MSWIEKQVDTDKQSEVTGQRAIELDQAREESLPRLKKEADKGQAPFIPVRFQPVRSPGIYEAEFAPKDENVVFHFWPYGYRKAERAGLAAPRFKKDFEPILTKAMQDTFGEKRIQVEYVKAMGAFFVEAKGWGEHQFMRDLCIKACEAVHTRMGGEG